MIISYSIDTPAELMIAEQIVDGLGCLRVGQIVTLRDPAPPEIMHYVNMLLVANYPEMAWTMTLELLEARTKSNFLMFILGFVQFFSSAWPTNRVASIQRIK